MVGAPGERGLGILPRLGGGRSRPEGGDQRRGCLRPEAGEKAKSSGFGGPKSNLVGGWLPRLPWCEMMAVRALLERLIGVGDAVAETGSSTSSGASGDNNGEEGKGEEWR